MEFTIFQIESGEPVAVYNAPTAPPPPAGCAVVPGKFYELEEVWVEYGDAMGFVEKPSARFRLVSNRVMDNGVPVPGADAI